jgi:hypothetical protein
MVKSMIKEKIDMTVKELYEWAKKNNAEDFDIEIQYRDGGGFYSGTDTCDEPMICDREWNSHTEKVVLL